MCDNTSGSDTTIAFGGSEADGHPDELIASNQAKLTTLTKEINDLHQYMEVRESQPAGGLDHLEWELQNLLLLLQPQPTSTPTPTDPYWEVIHQYTDILWTTQKQTNLNNSFLQDITVFGEYDSIKLEE